MDGVQKREQRIKEWIKDPHHASLIALILIMLAIRIYYFFITLNQPVWWDEGDYLNIARMWAFGSPGWDINPIRPVLLSLMIAGLMKMGVAEWSIRLIPFLSSILAIVLTYGIGKEMYDKKTGLIAAFMLASFWSFMFFSYRILVDVPVAMAWLAGIYLFIKGYEQKNKWALWLFVPAIVVGFLIKFTAALLGFILLFYLFVTDRLRPLKNKNLWISLFAGIITIVPFFLYEWKKFGYPLAFYISAIGGRPESPRSAWQNLMDFITQTFSLLHEAFLILFIIGFVIVLFELVIGFDLLFKQQNKKLKSHLLMVLSFIVPFLYLVSLGYGAYIEERYFFLMYPLVFIIGAHGAATAMGFIKKYNKTIAVSLVIIALTIGFYQNMITANNTIKGKAVSFIQVKEAGEWIQQRAEQDALVYSFHTQAELQYHANRRVKGIPGSTPEELIEIIRKEKPKYIVSNVFVPHRRGNGMEGDIPIHQAGSVHARDKLCPLHRQGPKTPHPDRLLHQSRALLIWFSAGQPRQRVPQKSAWRLVLKHEEDPLQAASSSAHTQV